jgi:hypothetical protein
MAEVATIEPRAERPLPSISAGGQVRAIIPQTFDEVYRIAKAISISGMAPKDFQEPEKIMVAIMHGAEVGLPPMQALQSIAVINGRPSIWGDGALGLVRGSGILEWIEETTEGTVAICRVKRKGEPKPIERNFSDEDAKAAGLLNKSGPWTQYRARMRQMRARSWALRDGFADVLRGLNIAEEAMDIDPARDVTPVPPPSPSTAAAAIQPSPPSPKMIEATVEPPKAKATAAPTPEPVALPPCPGTSDGEAFVKWVDQVLATAVDIDDLQNIFNAFIDPNMEGLIPPDREEVAGVYRRHERRLGAD